MTEPPPPYGTPPGYGQQPGYWWAPKPGIIPLRPLSLGDILGGAFGVLKWNPKATLVPSVVVAAISGTLLAVVGFLLEKGLLVNVKMPTAGETLTPEQVKSFLVPIAEFAAVFGVVAVIVAIVTSALLTGTLTVAVGQGVLGKKEPLGSALRAALARTGPLVATVVLPAVFIGLGWVAAVGVCVGFAVLLAAAAHLVAIGVLVGVLGYLTATVFAVIIGIRWSLAVPIVMLERRNPLASLGRSWQLVRGNAWRVFGITLVTGLIIDVIAAVITSPFQAIEFAQVIGRANTLGSTQLQLQPSIGSMLASGSARSSRPPWPPR